MNLISQNIDKIIAILTIGASGLIVLLGLSGDISRKNERLKFILLTYGIDIAVFILLNEFNLILMIVLHFICFLIGGLAYSNNDKFDLEKELNIVAFFSYSAIVWWFLIQGYINLLFLLLSQLFFLINRYFEIVSNSATPYIGIYSLGLFLQYILVVKDYFKVIPFSDTVDRINGSSDLVFKIQFERFNSSYREKIIDRNREFEKKLAFVIYCEDRNIFLRKSTVLSWIDIYNKFNDPSIYAGKVTLDTESRRNKYIRGYSTLEQQFLRQFSMGEFTYRYKFRRKIFFDWIYTPLFLKAVCKRKARTYGRDYYKKAQKELIWNLKFLLAFNYFQSILGNPKSGSELTLNMSRISRVSLPVYKKMYSVFIVSEKEQTILKKIEEMRAVVFNFY